MDTIQERHEHYVRQHAADIEIGRRGALLAAQQRWQARADIEQRERLIEQQRATWEQLQTTADPDWTRQAPRDRAAGKVLDIEISAARFHKTPGRPATDQTPWSPAARPSDLKRVSYRPGQYQGEHAWRANNTRKGQTERVVLVDRAADGSTRVVDVLSRTSNPRGRARAERRAASAALLTGLSDQAIADLVAAGQDGSWQSVRGGLVTHSAGTLTFAWSGETWTDQDGHAVTWSTSSVARTVRRHLAKAHATWTAERAAAQSNIGEHATTSSTTADYALADVG